MPWFGIWLLLAYYTRDLTALHIRGSPRMFEGGQYARELAVAQTAALNAARLLEAEPGDAQHLLEVQQQLALELSNYVVLARGPAPHQWTCFAEANTIVVALLSKEGQEDSALGQVVMSLVYRPSERATAFATVDGGAFVQRDGDSEAIETTAGGASMSAEVLHLPETWCGALDTLLHHLRETGTGIPVEVVQKDEAGGCCAGMLEVVLGRADVHVAPPSRFLPQQDFPPPQARTAPSHRRSCTPHRRPQGAIQPPLRPPLEAHAVIAASPPAARAAWPARAQMRGASQLLLLGAFAPRVTKQRAAPARTVTGARGIRVVTATSRYTPLRPCRCSVHLSCSSRRRAAA